MPKLSETLKNLLLTKEQRAQFALLDRIATALEVMAGLRPRTEQGKDESEVMVSDDVVYAQQEADELMKGRPEEED